MEIWQTKLVNLIVLFIYILFHFITKSTHVILKRNLKFLTKIKGCKFTKDSKDKKYCDF
jgi:hypothetical protein